MVGSFNRRIPGLESAMIVSEYPYGSPFAGQYQFRVAIGVQITPNRAADQSHLFENGRVLLVELPIPSLTLENPGGGGLRITTGNYSASQKNLQSTVSVHIGNRERSDTGF